MVRLLCAAFFLLSACTGGSNAAPKDGPDKAEALFQSLRAGGHVLVMRHANSPSGQKAPLGLSAGCTLGDGRGLDALGFYQARGLGEVLRAQEVPIAKAYTSPMCRSWDTAALAAAGAPVEMSETQISEDPSVVSAFKAQITEEIASGGGNIILASHSNIAPFYGATPRATEEEVPSGVIYVIDPATWQAIARIDLVSAAGQPSVAVE
ncbi:histidine phosphatase family protein [Hyphococcus sp. DH-69]|uniref:histidine phosphatase family protein n=1 Tax=Hyphococcus formosus TaxID=3143534 RepID=UPI00398A9084